MLGLGYLAVKCSTMFFVWVLGFEVFGGKVFTMFWGAGSEVFGGKVLRRFGGRVYIWGVWRQRCLGCLG